MVNDGCSTPRRGISHDIALDAELHPFVDTRRAMAVNARRDDTIFRVLQTERDERVAAVERDGKHARRAPVIGYSR